MLIGAGDQRYLAIAGVMTLAVFLPAAWLVHAQHRGLVALWLAIIWTLREFLAVRAGAAWLLAPYLIWVSFAVTLLLSIWRLNP